MNAAIFAINHKHFVDNLNLLLQMSNAVVFAVVKGMCLLERVERERWDLETIDRSSGDSGGILGRLDGAMRVGGYLRAR